MKKNDLIKNTFIIFVSKLCTQFISFLLLPLYTKYLISSEFGIVDLISTYISLLVPVISLQLDMSVFRYLIDYRKNEDKSESIIMSGFLLLILLILISIVSYIIISKIWNIKYGLYIILIVVVNMIFNYFLQVARGLGKTVVYSFSSFMSGVLIVAFNVLFIVCLKLGAIGMLLSLLFSNLIALFYLFFRLKIYSYSFKKFNKILLKKMIKYSLPLIPNGVSWWIMNASDRTIISSLLGMSFNGIYAVSNKFPTLLNGFFGIFNLAWSESVSLHVNSNDKDEYISSVCNDILKIFGYLGLLLIIGVSLFFDFLVDKRYYSAYYQIPILVVSSFFSLMAAQYGSIYIASKNTKKIAITTFISALINIIINLIFIRVIGLYAASLSTLISYFIIMIYRHFDTKSFVKIDYDFIVIIKLILLCVIVLIVYYFNFCFIKIITLLFLCILSFIDLKEYIFSIMNKCIKFKTNIFGR